MDTLTTTTIMTDAPAANGLLKLTAWLSPAFPVGSFSYSHGLESAAASPQPFASEVSPAPSGISSPALIASAEDLHDWLAALLRFGSGWNDAVLFAEAWRRRRSGGDIGELADLGVALAGSHERHLETTLQGKAFATALHNGWPGPALDLPDPCPYPIAVGAAAGAHGILLEDALCVWLQAFVVNLTQAAIRLGITGQAGSVGLVAALEPVVAETAKHAAGSTLDDLGSSTVLSDIMAMRHETHYSRLFRT
jgi:urease accessory protein